MGADVVVCEVLVLEEKEYECDSVVDAGDPTAIALTAGDGVATDDNKFVVGAVE